MIKILDKQVADKIAAGEVIDRPLSVIKELIENSLDAGADSIVAEIRKGGKEYIRITDNGCGISREEAETAFLRHATSKISSQEDLNKIDTLGFRGEALASICAVTRTELITKRKNDRTGTRLIIHGGEVISNQPTGCPDGTTLIITDLFYNTPARLKFMKSDSAESSLIIDMISRFALAYKDVSFRLINNGKVLFSTSGNGDRLNIISRIYQSIDIHNLTPVKCSDGELHVDGYISTPAMSRPSKSGQIFFVNGRPVNSKVIERGITEGYRERLFEGRFPIVFLFLTLASSDLDVNIHPNKREVRFDDEKTIETFISHSIKDALGTKDSVVRAANIFKYDKQEENRQTIQRSTDDTDYQVNLKNIMSTNEVLEVSPDEGNNTQHSFVMEKVELPPMTQPDSIETNEKPLDLSIKEPLLKPFDFDSIDIKGIIFDTYILAVDEDNFYLIDQHAAHERIFYEKLISEYQREEKLRQPILMPIIIDADISASQQEEEWLKLLSDMGFTIENFGMESYRISEIPTFMSLSEAEDFAGDFINGFEKNSHSVNQVVIDKLIMRSCKSAVKAGDSLSETEVKALMNDLKSCINPFSCPHGRPTFVKFSKYEIERMFKRS